MTLLNTLSNFGGTYPQYFVLKAVDMLTIAECQNDTGSYTCSSKDARLKCKEDGGVCTTFQDGYYVTSAIGIITGFILLLFFIRPNIIKLEQLPPKQWRLTKRYKK